MEKANICKYRNERGICGANDRGCALKSENIAIKEGIYLYILEKCPFVFTAGFFRR